MKRYKWVYYDWFNCPTYIAGTRREAKLHLKKIKTEQPSMSYHNLQKIRLLHEGETELSY